MKPKFSYDCRVMAEGDQSAVSELVKRSFPWFLDGDYWTWKYGRNPDFDPSLVVVAEENGNIVGCNHWLPRNIKISDSIVAKAVLGADIAVRSGHRNRGVGRSLLLFPRAQRMFKAKKAILTYMFAHRELSKHFYQPFAGYIAIKSSAVMYTKFLRVRENFWRPVKDRIGKLSKKAQLEKSDVSNIKILFRFSGVRPLTIEITGEKIVAKEENSEDADITVEGDIFILEFLKKSKKKMRPLLAALLKGRIRIRGNLLYLPRLYHNLSLMKKIFGW